MSIAFTRGIRRAAIVCLGAAIGSAASVASASTHSVERVAHVAVNDAVGIDASVRGFHSNAPVTLGDVMAYAPSPAAPLTVVYLHGMRGKATNGCPYMKDGASEVGWLVCPRADVRKGDGTAQWSLDVRANGAVVNGALASARARGASAEPGVAVGFSQGGYVTLDLVKSGEAHFRGLVLIAAPEAHPTAAKLHAAGVQRVVLAAPGGATRRTSRSSPMRSACSAREWTFASWTSAMSATPTRPPIRTAFAMPSCGLRAVPECDNRRGMTTDVSRRGFVASAIGAGFALAVQPVMADTITTDKTGLVADDVKIGAMPGYRAMPEGKGPFPLVIVIQEIFGVHEHIKDMCRRFAKVGYVAVAPELYYRQGDVKGLKDFAEILKVVDKVPDEEVLKDLDATVAWAKGQGKVDGNRVAVVGYCWGGRQVWLYSAHAGTNIKAGAAFYGPISNAPSVNKPKSPLDIAGKLKVPVIGFYGGKDTHIPASHVELMKKELATGSSKSEINVYPDADHGFNADYRPSYNKQASEDAWKKTLEWFKKNGV